MRDHSRMNWLVLKTTPPCFNSSIISYPSIPVGTACPERSLFTMEMITLAFSETTCGHQVYLYHIKIAIESPETLCDQHLDEIAEDWLYGQSDCIFPPSLHCAMIIRSHLCTHKLIFTESKCYFLVDLLLLRKLPQEHQC